MVKGAGWNLGPNKNKESFIAARGVSKGKRNKGGDGTPLTPIVSLKANVIGMKHMVSTAGLINTRRKHFKNLHPSYGSAWER